MARPTLTGQTKRMSRRQDGKLDSISLIPQIVTPPAPETGGPFAVRVNGDIEHGARVTITHDGVTKFTPAQGRVVISDRKYWGQTTTATPLTFADQAIVEWTTEYVVIDVDLTPWGGAEASAVGKRIYVLADNNTETLFAGVSGRKITTERMKLGFNPEGPGLITKAPRFRNLWAHSLDGARTLTGALGTLPMYANGYFNAVGNYVGYVRMYASKLLYGQYIIPQGYVGKVAVAWSGSAELALSRSSTVTPSSFNASTFVYTVTENSAAWLVLWAKNPSGSTASTFLTNIRIVPILDSHTGANDAERAAAAIADYDAGYAAKDERLFHPQYLQFHRDLGTKCLRFLDWSEANNTFSWDADQLRSYDQGSGSFTGGGRWDVDTQSVVDRPTGGAGWPLEIIFALAKALDLDSVWLTIPSGVENSYIDALATLIVSEYGDQLLAGKKLYVEYANEAWNGGFDITQRVCQLKEFYERPVQVATGTTGDNTFTCAGHGMSNGDYIFFIGGSYVGGANSELNISRTDPFQYIYVSDVTTDTFKVKYANGTYIGNWTRDGDARFMYETAATAAARPFKEWGAVPGVTKGQIRLLKRLKTQMSAAHFAGVVKFVSGQSAGLQATLKRYASSTAGVNLWNDLAYADLGPLEAVSIGPYYMGYTTSPLSRPDMLIKGRESLNAENGRMNSIYSETYWNGKGAVSLARYLEAADATNPCATNNVPWGTRVIGYEWGPHDPLPSGNRDPEIEASYSAEGAALLEYSMLAMAAAGVELLNHYGEVKEASHWSLTRSFDIDTKRWEMMRSYGGYVS
jgi:hypothetical protein